jgi:hypothetical protein
MVRKGAVEELEGSGNERNLESTSILAGWRNNPVSVNFPGRAAR